MQELSSHQRWLGMALCAAAMATVGSTVVASRLIASGLPPFTATTLRFAVAAPVLWGLMRLLHTPWPRPDRRDAGLLLVQAAAGSVGYTVLLILGTRYAPAADAGVVAGTLPAVAALFAVLALGERPSRALVLGIALATAGVLVISLPQAQAAVRGEGAAALLGHALVLGAVACEATFILVNKRLRVPVPPLALSTCMSALGLAVCVIPALLEQPWRQPLSSVAVGAAVYYALVPGVLGFWLWFAGSQRLAGAEASLMTAVMPVSALALAAAVLGERVSGAQLGGCALVLLAVLITAAPDWMAAGRRVQQKGKKEKEEKTGG
ncbi:DMT family transporter [Ottowia sp.]|uniref:DMT family transporter n=1 Tax=Ottowia sp. TaxID=1898956 RepID=UPI003A854734